jgi:hypothetical protein
MLRSSSVEHRLQHGIFFGIGAGLLRAATSARTGRQQEIPARQRSQSDESGSLRLLPFYPHRPYPSSSAPRSRIGRIGGRAVPCACFCVSISLTSMAGATALTGIVPDSAPHSPLKTSLLSPWPESSSSPPAACPQCSRRAPAHPAGHPHTRAKPPAESPERPAANCAW